jgi:hypothetical protein
MRVLETRLTSSGTDPIFNLDLLVAKVKYGRAFLASQQASDGLVYHPPCGGFGDALSVGRRLASSVA